MISLISQTWPSCLCLLPTPKFPFTFQQGWTPCMKQDFVVPRCSVPAHTLVTAVGMSGKAPFET